MSDQNEFEPDVLATPDFDVTTPGVEDVEGSQPAAVVETDETPVPEGTVLVVARRGYKFVLPGQGDNDDLVITDTEPIRVPEAVIEDLNKLSNGRLRVVDETKEG